ncbi:hypothetical protein BC833DRAFT_600711 [Globomyces pollinis-pini]|nr:hypothetical protein BC833DRAFT_600711 [Globomyces pollinis-pini]
MKYFLLPNLIIANHIISKWNIKECQGPPTLIEIQPIKSIPQLTYCGYSPIPMMNGCCETLIDKQQSEFIIETKGNDYEFPKSTNGYEYCKIQNLNQHLTFYLIDSCIQDYYKCTSQNEFIIYQDPYCQNPLKMILLNENSIQYLNMTITKIGFYNGTKQIDWITFTPSFTVDLTHPMEIIGIVFIILSLLLSIRGIQFYILYFKRKPSVMVARLFIAQLMWILFSILSLINWLCVWDDSMITLIVYEMKDSAENIASFLTVYHTITTLMYYQHTTNIIKRRLILTLYCLIHLLLTGAYYFSYWLIVDQIVDTGATSTFNILVIIWTSLRPFWFIFVRLVTMIPSLYISIQLTIINYEDDGKRNHFLYYFFQLLMKYQILFICFLAQAFNLMIYILIIILTTYSNFLKTDRILFTMIGPYCFIMVCNTFINCMLMNIIRTIFVKEKDDRKLKKKFIIQGKKIQQGDLDTQNVDQKTIKKELGPGNTITQNK